MELTGYSVSPDISCGSRGSLCFIGNLFQKDIQSWLFPPDPSINHNTARRDHLDGTASWFIQSGMFKEWKTTGTFLWIYGKRTHFFHFLFYRMPVS